MWLVFVLIALVILAVPAVEPRQVDELPESERSVRGFGSSAVRGR